MRLVAVVVIILCLGYWFSESIMGYWMAPAFQPRHWAEFFSFGAIDVLCGVMIGIALYAISRPSHYRYGHHYYNAGCSHHHNHGCGCR